MGDNGNGYRVFGVGAVLSRRVASRSSRGILLPGLIGLEGLELLWRDEWVRLGGVGLVGRSTGAWWAGAVLQTLETGCKGRHRRRVTKGRINCSDTLWCFRCNLVETVGSFDDKSPFRGWRRVWSNLGTVVLIGMMDLCQI